MKIILIVLVCVLIVGFILFIRNYFQEKDPLMRPLDKAISEHKAMLKKWESKQQKEIVAALLQSVFPAHHVHANPNTKNERK